MTDFSDRRRTILFFFLISVFCVVSVLSTRLATPFPRIMFPSTGGLYHDVQEFRLNGLPIFIETVTTTEAMAQGLGDRPSLATDHGMLFVYPQSDIYPFWMRHMKFSLDIIWFQDGKIIDVGYNVLPPKHLLDVPVTHTPIGPATHVLEVPAGQAAEYGLIPGSDIVLQPFSQH